VPEVALAPGRRVAGGRRVYLPTDAVQATARTHAGGHTAPSPTPLLRAVMITSRREERECREHSVGEALELLARYGQWAADDTAFRRSELSSSRSWSPACCWAPCLLRRRRCSVGPRRSPLVVDRVVILESAWCGFPRSGSPPPHGSRRRGSCRPPGSSWTACVPPWRPGASLLPARLVVSGSTARRWAAGWPGRLLPPPSGRS
jgi:hypothetical protein